MVDRITAQIEASYAREFDKVLSRQQAGLTLRKQNLKKKRDEVELEEREIELQEQVFARNKCRLTVSEQSSITGVEGC